LIAFATVIALAGCGSNAATPAAPVANQAVEAEGLFGWRDATIVAVEYGPLPIAGYKEEPKNPMVQALQFDARFLTMKNAVITVGFRNPEPNMGLADSPLMLSADGVVYVCPHYDSRKGAMDPNKLTRVGKYKYKAGQKVGDKTQFKLDSGVSLTSMPNIVNSRVEPWLHWPSTGAPAAVKSAPLVPAR
jgi:hypothetical protein